MYLFLQKSWHLLPWGWKLFGYVGKKIMEMRVLSKCKSPFPPPWKISLEPHLWSGLSWRLSVTTCCWCVGSLDATAARYSANADPGIELAHHWTRLTIEQCRPHNWFPATLYICTLATLGLDLKQTNRKLWKKIVMYHCGVTTTHELC